MFYVYTHTHTIKSHHVNTSIFFSFLITQREEQRREKWLYDYAGTVYKIKLRDKYQSLEPINCMPINRFPFEASAESSFRVQLFSHSKQIQPHPLFQQINQLLISHTETRVWSKITRHIIHLYQNKPRTKLLQVKNHHKALKQSARLWNCQMLRGGGDDDKGDCNKIVYALSPTSFHCSTVRGMEIQKKAPFQ